MRRAFHIGLAWTAVPLCLLFLAQFSVAQELPEEPAAEAVTEGIAPGTEKEVAGITFVWCPPGVYLRGMQLTAEELQQKMRARTEWYADAAPVHEVTLTRGFWMSKTEITREQWKAVMNTEPWTTAPRPEDLALPVSNLTLEDIDAFFARLMERQSEVFRLPTEAEWEYACRAGSTTLFYFGEQHKQLNENAWNWGNTLNTNEPWPHAAGVLKPNNWGLHDMLGNVWEWCQDAYTEYPSEPVTDPLAEGPGPRVIRGASYIEWAPLQLSSFRGAAPGDRRNPAIGLRVVLEP